MRPRTWLILSASICASTIFFYNMFFSAGARLRNLETKIGGKVVITFGQKLEFPRESIYDGLKFEMPFASPVQSLSQGRIIAVTTPHSPEAIQIKINDRETLKYGCLSRVYISADTDIKPGEIIGLSPAEGMMGCAHYHKGINIKYLVDGKPEDPLLKYW